ncbi:lonely Cys domain-containing protein, partial [Streptomyces sp. 2MCAF27]
MVLAIAHSATQYMDLMRAVATRLGRKVWAPSGEGRLEYDDDLGAHVLALMDRDPDEAVGAWVPFDPPAVTLPSEDREWTALDGTTFRDSDVETRPLTDDDHERFGRLAVAGDDHLRKREEWLRGFRHLRRLVHYVPAGAGVQQEDSETITPDPEIYVYAGHGEPGRLALPLRDGRTVWLGKRDAARYVAGLREVRELPAGHRLHLEVCWSASDGDPKRQHPFHLPAPHVDDPLEDVPLGQYAANESRREASAATRSTGADAIRRKVFDAVSGERARRVTYRPEPLDQELDQLARDAGLDTVTGATRSEVRATTLRLVRALRTAFGNEIEDDRGVPGGRYQRVLEGIGALERMRANDSVLRGLTPFRTDMWDFLTEQHSGRAPDEAGYLALLDFARDRLAARPGAQLRNELPSPALLATLSPFPAQGEAATRYVQDLSADAAVTPK